jgi:hypothetical protein
MKISLLVFLAVWLSWVAGLSAQVTTVPFEPDQLLAALPDAPRDWTLIRADGDLFLGDSLLSKATRVFQAPVRPSEAAGIALPTPASSRDASNKPPPPPGEVRIRILDTAGDAPSLADFADFKPGRSGSIEKKLFGSLPAIVFGGDETKQVIEVLVSSRYILNITFTNLPPQRVEDWLRAFHFDRLPEKSRTPDEPAGQFRLTHVDELHPEKNRSYLVSATDPKKLPKHAEAVP